MKNHLIKILIMSLVLGVGYFTNHMPDYQHTVTFFLGAIFYFTVAIYVDINFK